MWAVCGGLGITNFLLGNYMAVLVDPVFEKPVETAQVIIAIIKQSAHFGILNNISGCEGKNRQNLYESSICNLAEIDVTDAGTIF